MENFRLWDPSQKAMVVTRKRHDYLHFPGKAESHALGRRETTTLGSQVSLWECRVGVSKAGGPCDTPFHPHPPSHMVRAYLRPAETLLISGLSRGQTKGI